MMRENDLLLTVSFRTSNKSKLTLKNVVSQFLFCHFNLAPINSILAVYLDLGIAFYHAKLGGGCIVLTAALRTFLWVTLDFGKACVTDLMAIDASYDLCLVRNQGANWTLQVLS